MLRLPGPIDDLHFRSVNYDDLQLLRSWDNQAHVKAAGADDWDWEVDLRTIVPWRVQLIVEKLGVPMAFVQLMDPALEDTGYWHPIPPHCRAVDIWIGPREYLNQGFGSKIMRHILRHCFEDPKVQTIVIDPVERNTDAIRFYERLGFRPWEKRIMQGENILTMRLKRSWLESSH